MTSHCGGFKLTVTRVESIVLAGTSVAAHLAGYIEQSIVDHHGDLEDIFALLVLGMVVCFLPILDSQLLLQLDHLNSIRRQHSSSADS